MRCPPLWGPRTECCIAKFFPDNKTTWNCIFPQQNSLTGVQVIISFVDFLWRTNGKQIILPNLKSHYSANDYHGKENAFTIKIPTSICLKKAALMMQSKVSRILTVRFRIIYNAFVHGASYLGRTIDNALRNVNGNLCSVNRCCIKEIGFTGK